MNKSKEGDRPPYFAYLLVAPRHRRLVQVAYGATTLLFNATEGPFVRVPKHSITDVMTRNEWMTLISTDGPKLTLRLSSLLWGVSVAMVTLQRSGLPGRLSNLI